MRLFEILRGGLGKALHQRGPDCVGPQRIDDRLMGQDRVTAGLGRETEKEHRGETGAYATVDETAIRHRTTHCKWLAVASMATNGTVEPSRWVDAMRTRRVLSAS
jgi:hypothetical protein